MKGFLDKTWAKAAAFVLTLVFGVLTVLGGLGVAALISYDVFLDDGAFARQSLYENRCYSAMDHADSFLRGNLANAGLLSDADGYDYSNIENSPTAVPGEESIPSFLKELSQDFSNEFTLDGFGCHLTVASDDTGEVYLENFALTYTDKPLYTAQSTRLYTLSDGSIYALTYTADLLQVETAPTYSYLLLSWLTEHTGLTIFLTALFALLALFCFCFSMASAGHWAGHEGIHLTWLDKIPADVWLLVLLCTFFIGWEAFYYEWGRVFFCAALVPLVLLFLCAFAAQCKAGTVLRGALIGRIARFLWRIVRAVFRALLHTLVRLPLVWKTALVGLVIAGAEFLLYINDFYRVRYGVFLVMKLIELLAVLYIAVSLRTLQKGGEKLARGDFSSPIDTRYLLWDFKRYGQELNDVQGGLEQAVQEQMKAEHLKTELITNVSHDIKTPLTSIVNYVDLLKKEDIPSPNAQEYIAVLDRQSHRLKKLTEDLVEASKASSGALNVELQPTDVNVLLSQIEGEYQERLAACHLTLVTQPPAPGTMIQADSRLLSRVMDNLVSNVCKYAMENTRVYVTAAVRDGQAVISFKNVSRDELNISPDELMERFVRGDASRHSEGSGLGLSIARSLVQLQGGTFALSIDADLFRADIVFPLI
ncbi:sensor histidine kinase [Vescimonas sp.]|uniref:sensor histidine kinase n=1 Tax=Vescimonas sp. TaxID=2892404 RepID=UPI003F80F04F